MQLHNTYALVSRPARELLPVTDDRDDFSVTSISDCWGAGVIGFLQKENQNIYTGMATTK